MDNTYSTVPMWLVYELDSEGLRLCQPYQEVIEVGTLIDQSTGEDLQIVGWTTEDPYTAGTVVLPNGDWIMPDHVRANLLAAGARAANIRQVTCITTDNSLHSDHNTDPDKD